MASCPVLAAPSSRFLSPVGLCEAVTWLPFIRPPWLQSCWVTLSSREGEAAARRAVEGPEAPGAAREQPAPRILRARARDS